MTSVEFLAAFPEFSTEKAEVIARHLLATASHGDAALWGDAFDGGQGLLAAHNLVIEKLRMARGAQALAGDVLSISKENTGGRVSMSRGSASVMAIMENPLLATDYGQEYYSMLWQSGIGAVAL